MFSIVPQLEIKQKTRCNKYHNSTVSAKIPTGEEWVPDELAGIHSVICIAFIWLLIQYRKCKVFSSLSELVYCEILLNIFERKTSQLVQVPLRNIFGFNTQETSPFCKIHRGAPKVP